MKRSASVTFALLWLLALAPLAAALLAYPHLPAQIPTHWNADGTITYGARRFILLFGAISVAVTALMFLTRRIDPRRENYSRFSGAYLGFVAILNVFLFAVTLFVLTESLRPGTCDVAVFLTAACGILIAACGNLMPKIKQNYFIGVRTPWTLASETVWYRTHRLCGVVWVIGGLFIVLSAFLPSAASVPVLLTAVAALILVPYAASYLFFRREGGT
ncbi:MAG TPA: SdpI family protein [Candidatus Butyricicoccus stercorigallinarum]|nr:SdpI family protein [Candidatus Butyricicoccus stercorigallinarum]